MLTVSTAVSAQNKMVEITPRFFVPELNDVDIVSLYCNWSADTFYLHSSDSLYRVSSGYNVEVVPSEVLIGCSDECNTYISKQNCISPILTLSGDTIWNSIGMGVDFMICEERLFISRGSASRNSTCFVVEDDETIRDLCYDTGCTSMTVVNDTLFFYP